LPQSKSKKVAVIGGGPAGLMAAEVLTREDSGVAVTVYERMPSAGRKFLMAGRGGLNLTHSEPMQVFMQRYGPGQTALAPIIASMPPDAVRVWCEGLGQETFIGTSGRVFPRAMKASPLLRAWLRRLDAQGVEIKVRHCWQGWDDEGCLKFSTPEGDRTAAADATIVALGGGSWSRLGSDGAFVEILRKAGVEVTPLRAANCGVLVDWSEHFKERFQGQPLKRIGLRLGEMRVFGEALVTKGGLEGGAVYALSAAVREALDSVGQARLLIDLRPDLEEEALGRQLGQPRDKKSFSTFLRKVARLSPAAIGLLNEAALSLPHRLGDLSAEQLTCLVKAVPVSVYATAPIERAISTAGGIVLDELGPDLMIRRLPGVFAAGEMLDWEAPTGGYLLQACFASGAVAARGALDWLKKNKQD